MSQIESIDECFRHVPLFSWLNSASIAWFAERARVEHIAEGDTLYRRGSLSDSVFVIASGEVTFISGHPDDPNEQNASTLEAGDYFGELCLLEKKERQAEARAATDVLLYILPKKLFDEFAAANQDQHAILVTNLARSLARSIRSLNLLISRQNSPNLNVA